MTRFLGELHKSKKERSAKLTNIIILYSSGRQIEISLNKGGVYMALNYSSFIKIPQLKSEQRTARKLKDVSIRKHKPEVKARAKAAAKSLLKRFDPELRLMQKKANERMRQLELQDINSPAYQAIQAKLEILGRQTKGDRGRRFSETGRGSYNEIEMQKRYLKEFLEAKTSTLTGAKDYYDRVWETAQNNPHNNIAAAGITRDQWFKFFESLPDSKKDRMFYSEQVKIFTAVMKVNGDLIDENKITIEDIADAIQEADKLNEVFSNINDLYLDTLEKGEKADKDRLISLKDI